MLCRPIPSLWSSSSMHAMFVGKVVPQEFAFDLELINNLHMVKFLSNIDQVSFSSMTPAVLSRRN